VRVRGQWVHVSAQEIEAALRYWKEKGRTATVRDVVRLDPTRALTERLREQLSGRKGRRFALTVAQAPALRVLRDVKPVAAPPPVKRPRAEREPKAADETAQDPDAELEARVLGELAGGVSDLSTLTARITAELPREMRFVVAGRIAQIVAKLARPLAQRERPWVLTGDELEIEEWAMGRSGGQA